MSTVTLLQGDCLQKLKELKDNSIDSVVTDPPYEIGFMGKSWDDSGIANNTELWKEVLRVLKPGGHLLSFSHSRTYHRQAVAVEDAGFEIRDQILWIYGSGFPKSHNIGNKLGDEYKGIGTALKPAHEPIVMARKPLSEKTVAGNVLEWGTGGINIDGCRIGNETIQINKLDYEGKDWYKEGSNWTGKTEQSVGRFPANIIFDEEAGKILDKQSGTVRMASNVNGIEHHSKMNFTPGEESKVKMKQVNVPETKGGASRFFYCPKASKKDRNEGCDELEEKETNDGRKAKASPNYQTVIAQKGKNHHPTVKPTDLMAYLIRLVTPKGGTVLDPFMGSGSTGKASVREGFNFVGIEREDEYMQIAKSRIEHEQGKHNHRKFFDE
jgi:site-specific DNA-methyltransferase (adenine-specific)